MKKGKITVVITIAISCFALALVMCMQFKIVNQTDITLIETMREEELRAELANWKEMYKEAGEQYQEKIMKLNEYKEKQESAEEASKIVEKELELTNMYLGKTDVQGEGIEITLKNVEGIPEISSEDLLIVVENLKLAGAEAISINEERIINMSDITDIGGTMIKVDEQRIMNPYIIRAIGNPTNLESTLLGNSGYVEILKKYRNRC